jgi:hypothetical protein
MNNPSNSTPADDLKRIIESARRLGIELDEAEALQWLTAMAVGQGSEEITIDESAGVFGSRITMLDFSTAELAHFRNIGDLVGFPDQPGVVETALALSGSAAQSKIQTYPGDADYFERINIIADTREKACQVLSKIMQEKALSTLKGPDHQLIEVKFGSYPFDVIREGHMIKSGSPIAWLPAEIQSGIISATQPDGSEVQITWQEVANNPGWCKLDWVVADIPRGKLANASNMLDVTWEATDGSITPLDGYLDPYFQEVYLEASSIPLFTKLSKHVSSDALDDYVKALEHEVKKYLTQNVNYGKAAKRMYNIFRLTGRYEEAAFLRELFDEPTTVLYQVWSLVRTIEDCFKPDSSISLETLLHQADDLIVTVVKTMEGEKETEIVRLLLRLRDTLSHQSNQNELSPQVEAAQAEVINVVNNFYYDKLSAVPKIKEYMENISQ